MNQPTPTVSEMDVERIVRRDFSAEEFDEMISVLSGYNDREPNRVRLAILKIAKGRVDELRRQTERAKFDYRDVIAFAEYPGYIKIWSRINEISKEEKQKIIDQDWKHYETWLYRV